MMLLAQKSLRQAESHNWLSQPRLLSNYQLLSVFSAGIELSYLWILDVCGHRLEVYIGPDSLHFAGPLLSISLTVQR